MSAIRPITSPSLRKYAINRIRNIGIAAHIDAGKTTLTERILLYTGAIHHAGDVHHGDTTMDFDPIEKRKGITIAAAAISATWKHDGDAYRINIIDTPGHVDFTAEVERSMRVLDGAVAVFSGVEGVQPQSETVWRQATRYGVPRLAFVNKMDRVGADFDNVVAQMRTKLGANAWPVLIPIGREDHLTGVIDVVRRQAVRWNQDLPTGLSYSTDALTAHEAARAKDARSRLVEALAELDDTVAEPFLRGDDVSVAVLVAAIRRQTIAMRLVPVAGGSAFKYIGVQPLLDAVVDYLPSPIDLPEIAGTNPETGETLTVTATDDGPLRALVFKSSTDEFSRRRIFVRVYSGVLRAGDTVLNSVTGRRERIGRVSEIHADRELVLEAAGAGDIVVVAGLKEVATGHTLCAPDAPILLEAPSFPVPVVSMAIEPRTNADQERMGSVLARMAADDPTFKVSTDSETGQTIIAGMGELHLEVLRERMRETWKVDTTAGAPQIAYRETVTVPARGEGKQIKQSGGSGQYGHVILEMRPGAGGSGLRVTDKVIGGRIPRQFISSVRKGIIEAALTGQLGGYPVVDVEVDIVDGSFHAKDSNDLAFHLAGSLAFKDAFGKAKPVLLEPLMAVESSTPPEFQGDLIGDLSRRRGTVREVEAKAGVTVIGAEVPLAEMFGYAGAIRSLSKGRAEYGMTPARFEVVPSEIATKVLAKKK